MTQKTSLTVFVVEDDLDIARLVRLHLEANGFEVVCFTTAQPALAAAVKDTPSAFLLDIMLPGSLDGLDALQRIRKRPELSETPVIIMSSRTTEEDRILGLELGADDYVVKPFSPRELVARVKCVRRRIKPSPHAELRHNEIAIDTDAMTVTLKGKRIDITTTEFRILENLVRAPGRVISRAELLSAVRGDMPAVDPRMIDVYVCRLREKMGDNSEHPEYITTVRGIGYRFETSS
jgi:DNA-binding response OmpR family regulator